MSKTLNIFSRTNTANIKLTASPHRLTDKASDFESEDCGYESLCGRLFIIKSCAVFLDKPFKKPLKPLILKQDFERNCLKKPLKPLKSCFKLGEKSRLGYHFYKLYIDIHNQEKQLIEANKSYII